MSERRSVVRCDLHVHSRHSGMATVPLLGAIGPECHSEPGAVYEVARRRGMDLVTLTDHDTIEGALVLAGRPDTFVSEEVTAILPGGGELHLGVFDVTERQHEAIQGRRRDLEGLLALLAEQRIPTSVNHPFSAFTGRRDAGDLERALAGATLVETRNGAMSAFSNECATLAARVRRRRGIGGSDAHTLASIGRAYTCVPGRTRDDFLEGLRRGMTFPAGQAGTYARLTADVLHLARASVRDGVLGALTLAAAAPWIPLVTLGIYANETQFAWREVRAFRRAQGAPSALPRVSSRPVVAAVR